LVLPKTITFPWRFFYLAVGLFCLLVAAVLEGVSFTALAIISFVLALQNYDKVTVGGEKRC